jgi:hypothetical protein
VRFGRDDVPGGDADRASPRRLVDRVPLSLLAIGCAVATLPHWPGRTFATLFTIFFVFLMQSKANTRHQSITAAEKVRRKCQEHADQMAAVPQSVMASLAAIADRSNDRKEAHKQLISLALKSANQRSARARHPDRVTRTVLYLFNRPAGSGHPILRRDDTEGWATDDLPRPCLDPAQWSEDQPMVDIARAGVEPVLETWDDGRLWPARLTVPVRANGIAHGILWVESSIHDSFTAIDNVFLIFLAYSLASGLTLLGDDPALGDDSSPMINYTGGPVPTTRRSTDRDRREEPWPDEQEAGR